MANRNRELDLRRGAGLTSLQREIDRLFDDFMTPMGSTFEGGYFTPPVDVEETDDHFVMSFDLPGIRKEDLKIEVINNELLISGERKAEHEEKRKSRRFFERSYGRFERAIALPYGVDADKVEADYSDGVLQIAIPKSEQAKPKQIRIGESKGGFFQKLLGRKEEQKKEIEVGTKKPAA